MPLSEREQELMDAARCVGPSHRDRVLGHLTEALNHAASVVHHLTEAEAWASIGECDCTDELNGLRDLISDVRGKMARLQR